MDYVTRTTSRMVSRQKANIWHKTTNTQNLTTLASAIPEIFQGVWSSRNSRWQLVINPKVSTSRGQTVHKIWSLEL